MMLAQLLAQYQAAQAAKGPNTDPTMNYLGSSRNDGIPISWDQIYQDPNAPTSYGSYDPSSDSWTSQPAAERTGTPGWGDALNEIIRRNNAAANTSSTDNMGYKTALEMFQTDPNWAAQFFKQYPGSEQQVQSQLGNIGNQWANKGNPSILEATPLALAIAGGSLLSGAGAVGDAIPASAAGVGVEGGTGALAGSAGGAATTAASDATLQSILDSSQTPTISQGVNVADLGGAAQPLPASTAGVDAINSAAPGSITKGLTDITGTPFAPAAAGGAAGAAAGSLLTNAGTTAAGSLAANQVLQGGNGEPAPAPGAPGNPQIGNPDPNGYSNGNIDPKTGMPVVSGGAPGSISGTKLGDILSGNVGLSDLASGATLGDLGKVLGTAGATAGSVLADTQRANALKGIYNDMVQRRQPFLDKATGYLNDPSSYSTGPGAATLDSVLRRLSVGGNPVGDPAKLGIATSAGLQDWRNAVTGFGNLGLSGEDTRAGVASNAIDAGSSVYSDLGRGAANLLGAPASLADLLKQIKGSGSALSLA